MYRCTKGFLIEKTDDNGFMSDEYMTIPEGSTWDVPEEEDYRFVGGEVRLETDEGEWIEISLETLNEYFELIP